MFLSSLRIPVTGFVSNNDQCEAFYIDVPANSIREANIEYVSAVRNSTPFCHRHCDRDGTRLTKSNLSVSVSACQNAVLTIR